MPTHHKYDPLRPESVARLAELSMAAARWDQEHPPESSPQKITVVTSVIEKPKAANPAAFRRGRPAVPVIGISKSGERFQFSCMADAARHFNLSGGITGIARCLDHPTLRCKGMRWRRVKECAA